MMSWWCSNGRRHVFSVWVVSFGKIKYCRRCGAQSVWRKS